MPLNKEQKTEILNGLIADMKNAKAVVFSQFRNLSVADQEVLRAQMREQGVVYKVAKKTLVRLAAKEIGIEDISKDAMEGPVAVAFSMEDELAAAKLIHNFSKKHEGLTLLGSIFEGKALSVADTKALAVLPGKEELLTKFVFLLKSPIQGFHGVLQNTIGGFVRALDAIKEKQSV